MRKIVSVILLLMTCFALTNVARADAIVGPVEVVFSLIYILRPVILVAAVVVVTLLLLRRFRKKK